MYSPAHFVPWNSQNLNEWSNRYAQGNRIELNGLTTHYLEKGLGEPVLLLHGFFFDTFLWSKNIDVLAQHYKVYALDLWGFGYSSREPLDFSYDLYANQVLKFVDHLNLPQITLMGQSMGAGTAINFTVLNPDRVKKLVLVGAAALPYRPPLVAQILKIQRLGEFICNRGTHRVRQAVLKDLLLYNSDIVTDDFFEQVTCPQKIKGTTEVMLDITRKEFFGKLSNQVELLHQLAIPILLIWGKHDRSIPLTVGQQMHHILKKARLEVFDHAGHCPNIDQPDRFNRIVLDFLHEYSQVGCVQSA